MRRYSLVVLICLMLVAVSSAVAQGSHAGENNASAPNRAYLQRIWDGWSTLNPANVAQFYAQGPHTFYDLAPLKYSSWDEYQKGVVKVLADYTSAKFMVNEDSEIHPAGNCRWGTATVKFEMKHKNGKVDMGNMRWTVVFEKQGGKWLIVHEQVSVPMR